MKVTGNLQGLKPSQKKALERTFRRQVGSKVLISGGLASHLVEVSADIGRQVGVLVDRRGHIEQVFVGEPNRIYLPDIGRARGGGAQLRGLRHIHTVFGPQGLVSEDIADLTKLRLDAVATVEVRTDGGLGRIDYAHLANTSAGYRLEHADSVGALADDFSALVAGLEEELAQRVVRDVDDGRQVALIVGVYPDRHTSIWRLAEVKELANTAGLRIVDTVVQLRRRIDAKYVVGKGKLEEVVLKALEYDCELVIIDHAMTPTQARAIAAFSELKVLDRNQLILDIFAQRAQSRDGKLQVELAQLKYNLPRLTDMDAGLSRLTGGIGGRGPGETKLEINRRRARDKITRLEREIEKLSRQRGLRRQRRDKSGLPVISIVGYTNAGKSTLLNRLTQSEVEAADKLFATLDPSSRRLRFPRHQEAIVTDTVGFIRELPEDLVNAFRATLEELESADLLLHVCDVSDPMFDDKREAVNSLLDELGLGLVPTMLVLNKSDILEELWTGEAMARKHKGYLVSAIDGQGLNDMIEVIKERLWVQPTISGLTPNDKAAAVADS